MVVFLDLVVSLWPLLRILFRWLSLDNVKRIIERTFKEFGIRYDIIVVDLDI